MREFAGEAGRHFGLDIAWQGGALEERGIDRGSGRTVVTVDPRLFRPAEVDMIRGNPEKASAKLGWRPRVGFPELVSMMVDAERTRLEPGP